MTFRTLLITTLLALPLTALAQTDVHGVHPANMDPAAVPGDAWYTYANGAYLARTEIPADRTSISGFSTLRDIVNLDAWYAAFAVKPTQTLYLPPDQRVHIW